MCQLIYSLTLTNENETASPPHCGFGVETEQLYLLTASQWHDVVAPVITPSLPVHDVLSGALGRGLVCGLQPELQSDQPSDEFAKIIFYYQLVKYI